MITTPATTLETLLTRSDDEHARTAFKKRNALLASAIAASELGDFGTAVT
jgi:hypothetical protein